MQMKTQFSSITLNSQITSPKGDNKTQVTSVSYGKPPATFLHRTTDYQK